MTTRELVFGMIMPIVATLVAICVAIVLVSGCAAEKVACQVIHAADEVCTVIEYVGADGGKQQVAVPRQELQQLAVGVAARRVVDAGSDAH